MIRKVYILLIVLCLTSCLTVQKIERNCDKFAQICLTEKETTVIYDTTIVEKHDTIIDIRLEKETVTDTVFVRSNGTYLNSDTSYLTTGLASSEAFVWRSQLFHTLESGDTILNIRLNNALTEINHLHRELSEKVQTVTVKEDTGFGKFAKKWFFGSLGILFIGIILLILRLRGR